MEEQVRPKEETKKRKRSLIRVVVVFVLLVPVLFVACRVFMALCVVTIDESLLNYYMVDLDSYAKKLTPAHDSSFKQDSAEELLAYALIDDSEYRQAVLYHSDKDYDYYVLLVEANNENVANEISVKLERVFELADFQYMVTTNYKTVSAYAANVYGNVNQSSLLSEWTATSYLEDYILGDGLKKDIKQRHIVFIKSN